MSRFLPRLTATPLQATTYLLGIALFSISFLVFLNSSISFVVTDILHQSRGVGNIVGTLGFADELLALVACPLWGLLSDRVGVRTVATMGYVIVGASLVGIVHAKEVYPGLLLGRLGFSVGGAACSTMVTAILPAMTMRRDGGPSKEMTRARQEGARTRDGNGSTSHVVTPSISSELTITPARFRSPTPDQRRRSSTTRVLAGGGNQAGQTTTAAGTSQLAGFVGMFTGLGALLALAIFLPLPATFQKHGTAPADAVRGSFYTVGAIAICVAVFVLLGLRNLPGEEAKGFRLLFNTSTFGRRKADTESNSSPYHASGAPSYFTSLRAALTLGFQDSRVGIAYLGGFVARASSVGISLFIPLFVNAYFIREGLCTPSLDPGAPVKEQCKRAYTLAAILTGTSQLTALICAPLFGWLSGRARNNWPLELAAAVGIVGSIAFGLLDSPEPFPRADRGGEKSRPGRPWALLCVMLMGISQIGAIVCSLGLLGRAVNSSTSRASSTGDQASRPGTADTVRSPPTSGEETAPLLPSLPVSSSEPQRSGDRDRTHLKGTIAGIYSLAGGTGILLLTKLGGFLFDKATGAPFFMLAGFNAILLVVSVGVTVARRMRGRDAEGESEEVV
ncbi:hypothetical protein LTR50_007170 [Elasticomyces elasticus]|nr:hypothetical protein LTR50_007170 [Elasticomyces elasticus]